jgi:hypothetical protein
MLTGELEHVATATSHQLETETGCTVWCLGDDARILQIGRALVTTRSRTPAGTKVVVRARRRKDRAELSVEDDGPGIPPSQREAIFSRFYRVEGGKASGSGLGLAIAREIARVMGGEVRLESQARPDVFTPDLPWSEAPARHWLGLAVLCIAPRDPQRVGSEAVAAVYDPGVSEPAGELSHVTTSGDVRMVDGGKPLSRCRAVARGGRMTRHGRSASALPSGDAPSPLLAGIGRKRTAELIPLCHPLPSRTSRSSWKRGRRRLDRGDG